MHNHKTAVEPVQLFPFVVSSFFLNSVDLFANSVDVFAHSLEFNANCAVPHSTGAVRLDMGFTKFTRSDAHDVGYEIVRTLTSLANAATRRLRRAPPGVRNSGTMEAPP